MSESAGNEAGDRLEEILSGHREDDAEDAGATADAPDPYDPFAPAAGLEDDDQDESEDEEGDDLPGAPLFALLRTLEEEIPAPRMDRVWIFPPRRIEAGETAVVVVAAFAEVDPDRRRVFAAHYTALDDSDQHRLAVAEYGTAPPDRVGRLVEEVVERIKDGPAGAPRSVRIDGQQRRWDETLHQLAGEFLEEQRQRHRII